MKQGRLELHDWVALVCAIAALIWSGYSLLQWDNNQFSLGLPFFAGLFLQIVCAFLIWNFLRDMRITWTVVQHPNRSRTEEMIRDIWHSIWSFVLHGLTIYLFGISTFSVAVARPVFHLPAFSWIPLPIRPAELAATGWYCTALVAGVVVILFIVHFVAGLPKLRSAFSLFHGLYVPGWVPILGKRSRKGTSKPPKDKAKNKKAPAAASHGGPPAQQSQQQGPPPRKEQPEAAPPPQDAPQRQLADPNQLFAALKEGNPEIEWKGRTARFNEFELEDQKAFVLAVIEEQRMAAAAQG